MNYVTVRVMPSRTEDYEVLLTIGCGSYGKCQKIKRKSDGKILVWKVLDYGTMAEAEKQMLVSEVNLLRELKHPNIVRYYDRIIDRTNTTLYIVMEYCEGGDLASLINRCIKDRRYLEEQFTLCVMAQLSLALKEGDFGLARILNHDTSFAKTFVGTPYYMSPEQINRMSYNEKSDIWSLGCLLYELCALSPPFTAYNQTELAGKIREGKFRRIPYRFSDDLNTLLSKMLNLKDYLRPSVESILQNSLISGCVAQEQKRLQEKQRCRSADVEQPKHPEPSLLADLRLKEQILREREQALKEREQRLQQREQELCVREQQSNEKLARAESLLKVYNLIRQQRALSLLSASDTENEENISPGKKRVHFAGDGKENGRLIAKPQEHCLVKRHQWANMRIQTLDEEEKMYSSKPREMQGIR
ncbi:serine/threonine-protein kinase Nek2-like isoform X3 [Cyprinus carpio]|uniref:non-specific serine/threonine protein kinase n=1 Tax=Cyprinus carpio TaxID=7962 RepID=A0A9Q9Z7E0_CYPCA|nr:serine/threonine-protein kinase Nek2-like isoform X3 [Cyprinus carpio]